MLTLAQISSLLTVSVGISAGQVLFKMASKNMPQPVSLSSFIYLALNPYFIAAVALYGVMTFMWVAVLSKLPLSIAYPVGALVFAMVPVLAYFFLGEPLRWTTFAGAIVIITGVYISTL